MRANAISRRIFKQERGGLQPGEREPVYLQSWLAVRHCGRALGCDDDWHMEAVVGEGKCGARHAESLSQGVPGLLAEDGVHQLDDLVLWRGSTLYGKCYMRSLYVQSNVIGCINRLECVPGRLANGATANACVRRHSAYRLIHHMIDWLWCGTLILAL